MGFLKRNGPALLILLLAGCGGGISLDQPLFFDRTSWRQYNGAPGRVAPSDGSLAPPLEQAWHASVSSSFGGGSCLVAGQVVCAPALNGSVYLFDAASGEDAGHISLRGSIIGTPAAVDSFLFVPHSSFASNLTCVNLGQGRIQWTKETGPIESSLLVEGGRVVFATIEGTVGSISIPDSVTRWTVRLPKAVYSSPASDGERIFTGCNDGKIYAFRADSGTRLWQFPTRAAVVAPPAVSEGLVFVGSTDGKLYALDARTGTERWSANLGAPVYAGACVSGERVYIGTTGRVCFCLDRSTGRIVWETDVRGMMTATPTVAGAYIYLAGLDEHIRCLDRETGRIVWSVKLEGGVRSTPVIADSRLILLTESGDIFAFKRKGE